MSRIISVHSFRGGTGKSNTAANIATLLAADGQRVGVIDTDIQSPGIHVLFGLETSQIKFTLNDYLWGKCAIDKTAYDVSGSMGATLKGSLYLIPSSIQAGEIARVLREGYDVGLLNDGFHDLLESLHLDTLIIDTHPGLFEETLLSIAISDTLLIILRPDQQDYQGTGVTVEVARKLDVPRMLLVVNKVPAMLNLDELKSRVEEAYKAPVAALIPHSDDMMVLASEQVFVLAYPDHPVTTILHNLVATLNTD
jgi:MinD-like ATPase involved in chromosome partitioning or flagellar assembly